MEEIKNCLQKVLVQSKPQVKDIPGKSIYCCPTCQNLLNITSIGSNMINLICSEQHKISISLENAYQTFIEITAKPKSDLTCGQCCSNSNERNTPFSFCLDEQKFYCSLCEKNHSLLNHRSFNETKKLTHCPVHIAQYDSFCMDHLVNCCSQCRVGEHNQCKIVNLMQIKPNENRIQQFENELKKQYIIIQEAEKNFINYLQKMIETYQNWKKNAFTLLIIYQTFVNTHKQNQTNFNLINNLNEIMKKPFFPVYNPEIEMAKLTGIEFKKNQKAVKQFFSDYAEKRKNEEDEENIDVTDDLDELEKELKNEMNDNSGNRNVGNRGKGKK